MTDALNRECTPQALDGTVTSASVVVAPCSPALWAQYLLDCPSKDTDPRDFAVDLLTSIVMQLETRCACSSHRQVYVTLFFPLHPVLGGHGHTRYELYTGACVVAIGHSVGSLG